MYRDAGGGCGQTRQTVQLIRQPIRPWYRVYVWRALLTIGEENRAAQAWQYGEQSFVARFATDNSHNMTSFWETPRPRVVTGTMFQETLLSSPETANLFRVIGSIQIVVIYFVD